MRRDATYDITGAELRRVRVAAGLTQRQLAEKAKIHTNSVKRLERFDRIPRSSWHALERCAAYVERIDLSANYESSMLTGIPKTKVDFATFDVQFSAAHAHVRAQHGVLVKRTWNARKGDRPKCGAKTRRGTACIAPARTNGRCRMHGGLSTGPKTPGAGRVSRLLSGSAGHA